MDEQSIFTEALEKQDPVVRGGFLDRACAGNPDLRQRIERLLHQHQIAGSFLESPTSKQLSAGKHGSADSHSVSADTDALGTVQETAATVPTIDFTGNVLGDYELLEKIGFGGMGVVYRARQRTANRIVALKVIRPDRLMDLAPETRDEILRRFMTEAQAAARLNHDHIVTVYDVGEAGGQPYYSMRYIEGSSLADLLRQGPLENRRAAAFLEPVARAVHHAHENGIMHRDLKPQNVMIDAKERPYVADFGLAKLREGSSDITRTGQLMGTPAYMSPEQAKDASSCTPASDVYSLGATLYDLLTGRPPFRAANPLETMRQVIEEEPVAPRLLNPAIDRDLETITLKCLQKDAARRYCTTGEFADDVQRYLRREPILVRPISGSERLWRWCRRRPAIAAMTVALLLVFLGGFTGVSLQWLRANVETGRADRAATAARLAQRAAELQTSLATQRLERAQRSLYGSQLALVSSKWATDPSLGLKLLEDSNRCPGHMRDFTWRFFHRLCRRDHVSWNAHQKRVSFLAFAANGKTLVTGGWDGKVKVWDLATRTVLKSLVGHSEPVTVGAISLSGTLLVTGDGSGLIKVWDLETGTERAALSGLAGPVFDLTFSPDNNHVVASSTGTLLLWETTTGKECNRLRGPPGAFWSLAFRPDGKMLVAGGLEQSDNPVITPGLLAGSGGSLRLFTGEGFSDLVQSPHFSLGGFSALTFAPDGATLMGLTNLGALVEVNLSTFHFLAHERLAAETGLALAISHDGDKLATASLYGVQMNHSLSPRADPKYSEASVNMRDISAVAQYHAVRLWEPGTPGLRSYLHGITGPVSCLAFSPDGRLLCTGEQNGTVTIWDTRTHPERATFDALGEPVSDLHFSHDAKTLVAISETLRLWDVATGQRRLFLGHKITGTAVISPDGKYLVEGSPSHDEGAGMRVWDVDTVQPLRTLQESEGAQITAFSPDSKIIASAVKSLDQSDLIKVWDMNTGALVRNFESSAAAASIVVSPDGKILAARLKQQDTDTMRLWDIESGVILSTLEGSAAPSHTVISPDGKILAAAQQSDDEYRIMLWDTDTGKQRLVLKGSKHSPRMIIFSSNSDSVVVVAGTHSKGMELKQWDVWSGGEQAGLTEEMPWVQSITLSPDGRFLGIGGGNMGVGSGSGDEGNYGDVILWDIVARREHTRLKGHRSVVWSLAFSPDGKTVASGSFDHTAKVWDVATGMELATLDGHRSTVLSVAFSACGQYLATGSYDQTVKLWAAPASSEALVPWGLMGGDALAFGKGPPEQDRTWAQKFGAIVKHKELLANKMQLARENPTNSGYQRDLANGFYHLALAQRSIGQSQVAAMSLKQALVFRRALAEGNANVEEYQIQLASCHNDLCDLQRAIGDLELALDNGRQALQIQRKLVEEKPGDLNRQSNLGGSYNNVGMVLHAMGQQPEALAHLELALRHQRVAFDTAPQTLQYRRFLRNHYANLAEVHQAMMHASEAIAAAVMCAQLNPNDPNNLYSSAQILAKCVSIVGQGRTELSEEERLERRKCIDLAIRTLHQAIRAGFKELRYLKEDQAFQSLRGETGFQELFLDRP